MVTGMNERRLKAGNCSVISFALSALVWVALPNAVAAERTMMNAGMATSMRNAFPPAERTLQVETVFRSEDIEGADSLYRLEPQLLWGIIPQGFIAVGTSLAFANREAEDSGNVNVQALYNFASEGRRLPAAALMFGTDLPTGSDANRWGVHAMVILTKRIRKAEISFNAEIGKNAFQGADGRDFIYRLGLGADYPLDFLPVPAGGSALLRTAIILEQQEDRRASPVWQWEGSVFFPLDAAAAVAIGAHFALAREQPGFELFLGYQQMFQGW